MARLFGTDGIRGVANVDLTAEMALKVGKAAGVVLLEEGKARPKVLIGTDTRISSDMLEAAIVAGLHSVGADTVSLGVVPTPAVAFLVGHYNADAGIMLSASHNPAQYNGIKIFGGKGYKLSDAEEDQIEAILKDDSYEFPTPRGGELGRSIHYPDSRQIYVDHLAASIEGDLSGLRILVDCANGSASTTAESLFAALGADCELMACAPDGVNINAACGSTHIGELASRVKAGRYDAGVAYDGDADRCLMVDHEGNLVDGDVMIAIVANELKSRGKLKQDTVVVTVMSNLGFFKFAEKAGITAKKTKVGDRYVLECMLNEGYNFGGEQSGHLVFADYVTTGDGQLSSIQILHMMKTRGQSLQKLAEVITIYPQVLKNIVATPKMKENLAHDAKVAEIIAYGEDQLGSRGRILVRASGTEPLIRVMVEGENMAEIEGVAGHIAKAIEEME